MHNIIIIIKIYPNKQRLSVSILRPCLLGTDGFWVHSIYNVSNVYSYIEWNNQPRGSHHL
jgi:hypothetical protein